VFRRPIKSQKIKTEIQICKYSRIYVILGKTQEIACIVINWNTDCNDVGLTSCRTVSSSLRLVHMSSKFRICCRLIMSKLSLICLPDVTIRSGTTYTFFWTKSTSKSGSTCATPETNFV